VPPMPLWQVGVSAEVVRRITVLSSALPQTSHRFRVIGSQGQVITGHAELAGSSRASPTRVICGMEIALSISSTNIRPVPLLLLSCRRHLLLTAKDVLVQVLIAKLALGVVLPAELNKVRHLLVNTF
jgi:hypothetical protein